MRGTTIYLYELAWILPSVAIPVGMLVALMVTAFGAGIHVPGDAGRVDPTKLVVAATWLVALTLYRTYCVWRRTHPGKWTPLAAFMSLVTFAMWTIASLGITAEMIFMLLPWSFEWISGSDALLARTLFWFTGHPIVYFWLLPAYISWYTMVPRQAGGRLFSDPMARVSFL
jgi:cytochrome c oxidase subunit 1